MSGTGKKIVISSESGKSCFPKKEADSELIASLKFKKSGKKCKRKKLKSKSKCHAKTINSALLKRTVTESPSKDDSASSKLVNQKSQHKGLDKKSSKKLGSLKHKGKETKKVVISKGEVANGDVETKKLSKRKKKKRQKERVDLDEASRLQRRARNLLIKMKLEQNLIDAYSGEGWKGQSREKIRPEKELHRAKKQILKCKLGIRDAIRQLDSLSSVGCIEGSAIAADGSVHHEHIICAKCKLHESFPDNDIVLCDGTCNCAFHQKCLDPPLDTENIPPGDQGWFCRFCECKMEIIEAMNAHIGTLFSVNSNWQDIFKDEAAFPDGGSSLLDQEEDWPSDDSEDDDYNPEGMENSCSISGAETVDDASNSTSLSCSPGDKAFAESQGWEIEGNGYKNFSVDSSLGSDETSDGEIICGRRQRGAVDYKKLYDEMFGKDASAFEQVSEDEDWGPAKRRRREKESDAVNTLMTLYGSEEKCSNVKTSEEKKKHPSDAKIRRPFFRIPPNAVEKLRQVFAENELPSRVVKDNLSKELGLEPEKVNKWFKNARYIALKTRKVERANPIHSSPKIFKESRLETKKKTTAEVVALKEDVLKETLASTLNNSKKIRHRKDSKSLSGSLKKNQHRRASPESPVNSNQANLELSDDMSLKKFLKAKPKKAKKVNFIARDGSQAAEAELEKLCRVQLRLEILKQKLPRLLNKNAQKSNKNHLCDESVMYVPVAEVREKV